MELFAQYRRAIERIESRIPLSSRAHEARTMTMRDLQSAKLAVIGLGYVGLPLAGGRL